MPATMYNCLITALITLCLAVHGGCSGKQAIETGEAPPTTTSQQQPTPSINPDDTHEQPNAGAEHDQEIMLDEVTIAIQTKQQPPDLRAGDQISLYASIPVNRSVRYMIVLESVQIIALDELAEQTEHGKKYETITIQVRTDQTPKLLDLQRRIADQRFSVIRRAPGDVGLGRTEISPEVLEIFRLE